MGVLSEHAQPPFFWLKGHRSTGSDSNNWTVADTRYGTLWCMGTAKVCCRLYIRTATNLFVGGCYDTATHFSQKVLAFVMLYVSLKYRWVKTALGKLQILLTNAYNIPI